MSSTLRLDWASHKAARYAVERWHYTGSMPTPPTVRIGVWENGRYIGAVIFSRGSSRHLGRPYGLGKFEVCELTRVALDQHQAPVSQIVAGAIQMLRRHAPKLRLIVSFADPAQGHVGTIYQAGSWLYLGQTQATWAYRDRAGRVWHERQVSPTGRKKQYGQYRPVPRPSECERIRQPGKHRYVMPLDRRMRRQLTKTALPYPAGEGSTVSRSDSIGEGQVRSLPSAL